QRHLTREYVDGFEPDHEVPASAPMRKPQVHGQPRMQQHHKRPAGDGQHTSRGRGGEGHNRPQQRNQRPGNRSSRPARGNSR
ncbi:MAG: hypothetical protein KA137_04840, partial [Halioglobus sp.]|nr:hypothetical protein [Halioglobus sp.]